MRSYKNVELKDVEADMLKLFLKENNIMFETSGCGFGCTHFEVFVNERETSIINSFLNSI